MNYRFEGKATTMAMGVFPLITLAVAREKREATRKLLAAGSDPTATRKEAEAREPFEATTGFRTVAEEWLAKRERETVEKRLWQGVSLRNRHRAGRA
ncbi:Arm DNA-binding domain-containing protein [Sphingobium tyrosinilyticum]|uniref:Arm DNA-binding domain-containing protein n=1 Tax=Sphingobium tyrosinilyticum TaxID=2715436 RepID=A0ABV9F088_9SPHN